MLTMETPTHRRRRRRPGQGKPEGGCADYSLQLPWFRPNFGFLNFLSLPSMVYFTLHACAPRCKSDLCQPDRSVEQSIWSEENRVSPSSNRLRPVVVRPAT